METTRTFLVSFVDKKMSLEWKQFCNAWKWASYAIWFFRQIASWVLDLQRKQTIQIPVQAAPAGHRLKDQNANLQKRNY